MPTQTAASTKLTQAFAARIRRAENLAGRFPFAAEILNFYLHVAKLQQGSLDRFARVAPAESSSPLQQRGALPFDTLAPDFRKFLGQVESRAPRNLAAAARAMMPLDTDALGALLTAYWTTAGRGDQQTSAVAQFFPRAFLQPLAELCAAGEAMPPLAATTSHCPLCNSRPLLGVLRPEGDGAKRFLLCSFCQREWEFRRILCATCGEADELKLPVYVAESLPHIRVEACEMCHFNLRSIDLTKDGHAVPIVDDLPALPLTLWAQEHHYFRVQPNLLGT
jgi:FdhE protein